MSCNWAVYQVSLVYRSKCIRDSCEIKVFIWIFLKKSFWLQIPQNEALIMDMVQSKEYLAKKKADLLLTQGPFHFFINEFTGKWKQNNF